MTQYFEKMAEHSNSKIWRQNLRLLRTGQFEHCEVSCKEEVESRRDSIVAWIPVHLKLFFTFEQVKAILEEHT